MQESKTAVSVHYGFSSKARECDFLTFDLKTLKADDNATRRVLLHFAFVQSLTKNYLCEKKNRQFVAYNGCVALLHVFCR